MNFSDETLMAYADEALAEPERGEVERALRTDLAVAARVAQQRALRSKVFAAFAPVLDEPVPPRLVAAALPGKVADLSAVRAARAGVAHPAMAMVAARAARAAAYHDERRGWSWRNWTGLAVALAMGVLMGSLLADGFGVVRDNVAAVARVASGAAGSANAGNASTATVAAPAAASAGGVIVANGPLATALSRQMAGMAGETVDIGISFFNKDGTLCRSFAVTGSAGLACRRSDEWQLVWLMPAGDQRAGGAAQAGMMPAALLDAIDARIDGAPLNEREEHAARQRGWKR